ncbi:MAG: beta-ketoacyl-ACP synthase II [Candidatus Marinamargulisbacteria bacterium]
MLERVVVTGYGTINPLGHSLAEYSEGLKTGRCGIRKISSFDTTDFSASIAGEITDADFSSVLSSKEIRRTSRFIILALKAAIEAVSHSGLVIDDTTADTIGVEIGSGIGGIEVLEETTRTLIEKGPSKVSPFTVPMMIIDMASGLVSIKTGAKGPNSATVTACASSTHAIGNAYKLIQRGDATAMITGGAEACITPVGLSSFCAARALTSNPDPETACRPFDANRDGFVMGEGAGVLILESLTHAKARGATIYGEITGYGASGDAYHITAPAENGEGAQRAMKMALNDAQLNPTDIDYINAHGTSTKLNDKYESIAMKEVFGEHAYNLHISSTKSMTGHLLGAAGAIEMVACLDAMAHNYIPPTINHHAGDADCDLNYTPNTAIEATSNITMSNSFGFGGHNAVLIAQRFDGA